jgi:hypothetical protein
MEIVLLMYCSEILIYHSQMYYFPGAIQFLWSVTKSYLNCGPQICCFPISIILFQDPGHIG